MGFPYNELIAPAILLDNPGITREEFIKLLNKVHSFSIYEFKEGDPWNCKAYMKHEDKEYHQGLEGLAHILSLECNKQYKIFKKHSVDEYGLFIRSPYCLPLDKKQKENSGYKFEVICHIRNILGESQVVRELSWGKLKVGDMWEECQLGEDKGLVGKIFEEKCFYDPEEKDRFASEGPRYEYKMEIAPIHGEYKRELFTSEEELHKAWPQFHPDFVYNWSQKTGSFPVLLSEERFLWLNKDGKYYLDKETFNRISASFRISLNFGYTDLILTSEAIKHKAWKILSYRGLVHSYAFLRDFPDIKPRYEKAVWDGHTSLYAKQRGMTNYDLLRTRMIGFKITNSNI